MPTVREMAAAGWVSVLLADGIAVVLFIVFTPVLAAFLRTHSLLHALFLAASYLVFCASVWGLRQLETVPGSHTVLGRYVMLALAAFFGVFVVYMIVEGSGVFDRLDTLSTDLNVRQGLGVLLATAAGLLLAFLYMGILAVDVSPSVMRGTASHALWTAVTTLGVNWMIVVTAAHWEAFAANTEPYTDMAFGGKVLVFLAVYAFFLLFYAPPRLALLTVAPGLVPIGSFLIETVYIVWRTLSRAAW